jgi:bacillithiol biosynthesis cysteine-adding enzyme BshC
MYGQVGVEPYGEQIITVFKKYYKESVTIQQATLQVVNELFGEYGLVILIPDNANLKKLFNSVVKKELTELFSYHQVNATLSQLKTNYKVQAGGRELNLFYLINDKRERIEVSGNRFQVTGLKLSFSLDEIFSEVENHPERFSPNVILRGVFQETILPNIAFIGGGGELAYWLELKKAFEEASIPYPVLVLRNSFLLVTQQLQQKIKKLGFNIVDFFKEEQALLNELVKRTSTKQLDLQKEREQLQALYQQLKNVSSKIDTTLNPHIEALQIKADKRLEDLEKKMLRTERKKFEAQQRQIHKIKNQLFPDDNLQERVENVSGFYAAYGKYFFDLLLANSLSFEQQFAIVTLPDSM